MEEKIHFSSPCNVQVGAEGCNDGIHLCKLVRWWLVTILYQEAEDFCCKQWQRCCGGQTCKDDCHYQVTDSDISIPVGEKSQSSHIILRPMREINIAGVRRKRKRKINIVGARRNGAAMIVDVNSFFDM